MPGSGTSGAFNDYCKVGTPISIHKRLPASLLPRIPTIWPPSPPLRASDEWNYALETTVSLPVPNNGSEAINLMMAEWERVMLGEISVEEMVASVNPQMNELIKDTPAA